MISRQLPQQLKGRTTRNDKEWYKLNMNRFNQYDEYNKIVEYNKYFDKFMCSICLSQCNHNLSNPIQK
jgi:hypothetical protein